MNRKLSTVERIMVKIIIIQLICLFIGQWAISHEEWAYYLNKSYYFEGVIKEGKTITIETIDHLQRLWYD